MDLSDMPLTSEICFTYCNNMIAGFKTYFQETVFALQLFLISVILEPPGKDMPT